jgi:bacterioferritin-associated ferredoxin
VYYAADGTEFEKNHVRVRVGLKETEDPVTVCYCFGVTERMIREDVQRTGRSSASARIRAEVNAGNCRCEVENPSGRCCLGEVIQAEKRAAVESRGNVMLSPVLGVSSSGTTAPRPEIKTTAVAAGTVGGLLAAFLASVCCIGPVVFAALGVGVGATGFLAGTADFLKALLPYRPLFIGLTVLFLGVGFYVAYRNALSPCGGGMHCSIDERRESEIAVDDGGVGFRVDLGSLLVGLVNAEWR